MRSTPLAMMSAAAVLVLGSGPALGAPTQDDSFGTLEEMVVVFNSTAIKVGLSVDNGVTPGIGPWRCC